MLVYNKILFSLSLLFITYEYQNNNTFRFCLLFCVATSVKIKIDNGNRESMRGKYSSFINTVNDIQVTKIVRETFETCAARNSVKNFPVNSSHCTTMATGVSRVILRCEDAMENEILDLSECQLMQVPDAVYHLMRHTELKSCDLSGNVITKIPPKFAVKFSLITDLNMSHNQMSKLPDEIADLGSLQRLDISHNTFISLPNAIFKIPKLELLIANDNHIVDVEVDSLKEAPSLSTVDLRNNPLTARCHGLLAEVTEIQVSLSPREIEDWEDLNV